MMPAIPGFVEAWGISAIHCPYCHGYEVRDQKTGILVNNENAHDFAKLILNWTDQLTVYTNGPAKFDIGKLHQLGVQVDIRKISAITHTKGEIKYLVFTDNTTANLDALYHRAAYEQHCKIPGQLGCKITESGHIEVNDFQQTSLPGIYAVGDATTPFRSIAIANASGAKAAFILNHEIINER